MALAVDPGPLMQHARQLTSRLDHLRTPAHHRSSHLVNVIIGILQPTPTVHLPILDGAGVHRSLVQQEPRRRRDGVGSRRFRDRLAYSVLGTAVLVPPTATGRDSALATLDSAARRRSSFVQCRNSYTMHSSSTSTLSTVAAKVVSLEIHVQYYMYGVSRVGFY